MVNIKKLIIGKVGINEFSIPIIEFGSGYPKTAIVGGIHGDEQSSLFIIDEMISKIKSGLYSFEGTISFFPFSNPITQIFNSRITPIDNRDLNRLGRGNEKGSISERIAQKLFDELIYYNLVIDIHNFEMLTPFVAVFSNRGKEEVGRKILNSIKILAPDFTWYIDSISTDYNNILCNALIDEGIMAIPIEVSSINNITSGMIEKVSNKIFSLINKLDTLSSLNDENLKLFKRIEFTSDFSGLWYPANIRILENIDNQADLGTIVEIPSFERIPILSFSNGLLLQYRKRQLVSTGTALVSIGQEIKQIIYND